jgi:hypothetical protein
MCRVASWVFVVLLAVCGVAQGKQPASKLQRWSAVEALPQDTLIEVGRDGQAGVEVCRVESSDDSALTCVAERPEGDARIVFPRGAVRNLWVIEVTRDWHIGRWIVVAVGAALLITCGVEGGVFGLAIFGPLIVGLEVSYFEDVWRNPQPQMPRVRRRLVYTVP